MAFLYGALRQCHAIKEQDNAQQAGYEKLHICVLELAGILVEGEMESVGINGCAIHKPHNDNEADCTQDSDWREVLDRIQAVRLQYAESRCVRQCQGGHIESNAQ